MLTSYAGDRGIANAQMVMSNVTVSTMTEVKVEYREKAKMATKEKDHSNMRKKRPNPIPKTRGPSSAAIVSKFSEGADILLARIPGMQGAFHNGTIVM